MAAPVPARPRANCQEVFKYTLLSVGVVVIAGLAIGLIELRDLQDRLGWTPSNETLYAENKLGRETMKTLKKEKVDLEHKVQRLEKQLKTTTDKKNEHKVDAKICANSRPSSCWLPVISATLIGFFSGISVILCCCCYIQLTRYHDRRAVVAYRE